MNKLILSLGFILLLSIFSTAQSKNITKEEYDSIYNEAMSRVEKTNRIVKKSTDHHDLGSPFPSTSMFETLEILLPDRSRTISKTESSDSNFKDESIIIGNIIYRKTGKTWVKRRVNPENNKQVKNEDNEDLGKIEYKIENKKENKKNIRILTFEATNLLERDFRQSIVWINEEGLIYKIKSVKSTKSGLSIKKEQTDFNYEVKDLKIEAPIK